MVRVTGDRDMSPTFEGFVIHGGNTGQEEEFAGRGGGITNPSALLVQGGCWARDNTATTGEGGGLHNGVDGSATVDNSTIGSGDHAGNNGGGIWNAGTDAAVTRDIDDDLRPIGAGADIGADEAHKPGCPPLLLRMSP